MSLWLLLLIFCLILGFIANCYVQNRFQMIIDLSLIKDKNTLLYGVFLFLVFFSLYFSSWYKSYWSRNSKNLMENKERDKNILSGLEQAHFQTEKELSKNFKQIEFSNLKNANIEGIPIKAQQINKTLPVTLAKPSHTLVIGTTGSGKTTSFINPTIKILANSKNKPSMLVSDPKGELYSLHTKSLKKLGYEVKVIDLRNPYNSVRWNPLEKPYLMYQKMLSLDTQVKEIPESGCYIFENKTYYKHEELLATLQVKKQEIYDEIYEDLHDIISVLCPVINKSEPIWESGARNFILAITLAMLEDSEDPELGMTKEKFNFYNIMKIATNTQNECEDLIKYFLKRSPISKSVSLSKQVLDASDKTRGSYLSTIFDKLAMFSDKSICALTSSNEVDFGEITNKPTVLFLQIPDEKETRHTLASMIILQAYKGLVAKANTYKDLSLPRSVYFLLDEFGNLPRVHKLEQMITVGRSRKIWLTLVVQSYAQLSKVYDDKSADIIKSNCNIQVFIGTTDLKTIEDFSKLCGNYSIVQRNVSFSTSKSDEINSSASVKERPLIYPSELAQLNNANNMGNAVVTVFGFPPIKSKFTPSFKCKQYKLEQITQEETLGKPFMEEKVFYDMLKRNEYFFKPKSATEQEKEKSISEDKKTLKDMITLLPIEIMDDFNKELFLSRIDGNLLDALYHDLCEMRDNNNKLNADMKKEFDKVINQVRLINFSEKNNETKNKK
jgi:type IV secretion system protein VirD4